MTRSMLLIGAAVVIAGFTANSADAAKHKVKVKTEKVEYLRAAGSEPAAAAAKPAKKN